MTTTRPNPTEFGGIPLHANLVRAVRASGFSEPRPIQRETLPAALEGADVLGLAQTGTGKTAAFALPLLHRLLAARRPGPRALVLAPTRELATQIDAEVRRLAQFTHLETALVFGGASVAVQIHALRRRPDVIVACPGRLLDLVAQRAVRLDQIEILVIDEADHMFDMGFLPSLRRILSALPAKRQNLLFSATMPPEIRHFADKILRSPHVVALSRRSPARTIEQALYWVPESGKRELLASILASPTCSSAIVFARTKHRARRLAEQLERAGHRAVGLQGNMSQGQRERAMRGFRERRYDILVATDIAARGIDVSDVSHVINYDVPNTPEAYIHRIGRTGRSERRGEACTFATGDDRAWVRATESRIGEPIPRRQAANLTEGEGELELASEPSRAARGKPNGAREAPPSSYRRRRGRRSYRGRRDQEVRVAPSPRSSA